MSTAPREFVPAVGHISHPARIRADWLAAAHYHRTFKPLARRPELVDGGCRALVDVELVYGVAPCTAHLAERPVSLALDGPGGATRRIEPAAKGQLRVLRGADNGTTAQITAQALGFPVWSTTRMHWRDHGPGEPITLGLVELDEGPWLHARLTDLPRAAAGARARLSVLFPRGNQPIPSFTHDL